MRDNNKRNLSCSREIVPCAVTKRNEAHEMYSSARKIHVDPLTSCTVDRSNEVDAAVERLILILLLTTTSRRLLVVAIELKASVVAVRTPTSKTAATLAMRTIGSEICLIVDVGLPDNAQYGGKLGSLSVLCFDDIVCSSSLCVVVRVVCERADLQIVRVASRCVRWRGKSQNVSARCASVE